MHNISFKWITRPVYRAILFALINTLFVVSQSCSDGHQSDSRLMEQAAGMAVNNYEICNKQSFDLYLAIGGNSEQYQDGWELFTRFWKKLPAGECTNVKSFYFQGTDSLYSVPAGYSAFLTSLSGIYIPADPAKGTSRKLCVPADSNLNNIENGSETTERYYLKAPIDDSNIKCPSHLQSVDTQQIEFVWQRYIGENGSFYQATLENGTIGPRLGIKIYPQDDKIAKLKKEKEQLEAEVDELDKLLNTICPQDRIERVLKQDLAKIDTNELRNMAACDQAFAKTANEIDKFVALLNAGIQKLLENLDALKLQFEAALSADFGLSGQLDSYFNELGMADHIENSAASNQSFEWYSISFYSKLGQSFLTNFFNKFQVKAQPRNFLITGIGWARTQIYLGKRFTQEDEVERKIAFLEAAENVQKNIGEYEKVKDQFGFDAALPLPDEFKQIISLLAEKDGSFSKVRDGINQWETQNGNFTPNQINALGGVLGAALYFKAFAEALQESQQLVNNRPVGSAADSFYDIQLKELIEAQNKLDEIKRRTIETVELHASTSLSLSMAGPFIGLCEMVTKKKLCDFNRDDMSDSDHLAATVSSGLYMVGPLAKVAGMALKPIVVGGKTLFTAPGSKFAKFSEFLSFIKDAEGSSLKDIGKLYGIWKNGAKFHRAAIKKLVSFTDEYEAVVKSQGLSLERFHSLRVKRFDTLTEAERKMILDIRKSIPQPDSDTLMQKVIPAEDVALYLKSERRTIKGYVSRAQDTKLFRNTDDYYNGLALNYRPKEDFLYKGESMAVIRFKSQETVKLKIPSFENKYDDPAPFTGLGFTQSSSHLVPEFHTGNGEESMILSMQDGAEMYSVFKDGTEKLTAIFNAGIGKFITVE
jgi:hypothetical protein